MPSLESNEAFSSINNDLKRELRIMEVCGTHTQVIAKAGFAEAFYPEAKLISGPGCPVCVTSEGYIDAAIEILQHPNTILATFGDLIRVRGSQKSLEDCMKRKNRIRVVYSPFAALEIAESNNSSQVVFLAIGFETTAPLIAAAVKLAESKGLKNLSFLVGLKLMPPVLEQVLSLNRSGINGLICPGHVSVIMGSDYFSFVPQKYGIPAVVSGFENRDVLASIEYLVSEIKNGRRGLKNLYTRCVRTEGNITAKELMEEVFYSKEGCWRGIGNIDHSELAIQKGFQAMDAAKRFAVRIRPFETSSSCRCGEIITGSKTPFQCSMFGSVCNIENPMGPCMVSSEGTCAIYYKYKRGHNFEGLD